MSTQPSSFFHKSIAVILGITFISASCLGLLVNPRPAEAVTATVVGGAGTIPEIISAAKDTITAASSIIMSGSLVSITTKEFVLDPIAWALAKMVIKHMTRSIVNWINSGFKGSPAFVTDPAGFLADVLDKEIGNFIYGTELGFLCDPFELDIRLALGLKYRRFEEKIACRLSNIVDNIQNFVSGSTNFNANGRGWDAWYQLVVDDNPYNRYVETSNELSVRIRGRQDIELLKLDWGRGFLSWEECSTTDVNECRIVTPGSVIQDQLSNVLGSDLRQLELADEINEIVGALAAQLLTQALGGTGGLLGTSASYGGQSSYLDRMVNETVTGPGSTDTDANPNVAKELRYREPVADALGAIQQLQTTIGSCIPASQASFLAFYVSPYKLELENKIAFTDQNIFLLRQIDARIKGATTPEELSLANNDLLALMQSSQLHDEAEIVDEQRRRDEIRSMVNQVMQTIPTSNACTGSTSNTTTQSDVGSTAGDGNAGAGADGSPGGGEF